MTTTSPLDSTPLDSTRRTGPPATTGALAAPTKPMIRHRILLRLSAVLAAAAAGCGDGPTDPPPSTRPTDPPSPATLVVSPATAALHALRSTVQLTAEVRDDMGNLMPGANVGWTSGDNSVATV